MKALRTCLVIQLITFAFVFLVASKSEAAISYSDGEFNDNDWDIVCYKIGDGSPTSSCSSLQEGAGGNPDSFRRISLYVTPPYQTCVIDFHRYTGVAYDPQTQGAIDSLFYSEDAIAYEWNPANGQCQATGPALLQNDTLYIIDLDHRFVITSDHTSWTHWEVGGLTAEDFMRITTQVELDEHPDFSAAGAPISVGFYRWNCVGTGSAYGTDGGIDNWFVAIYGKVDTIPSLSNVGVLLLTSFLLMIAIVVIAVKSGKKISRKC